MTEHLARLEELRKKYPHAYVYITAQGILEADQRTLETWEFEAKICDHVLDLWPEAKCDYCKSRRFLIGNKDIIVDFSVPFVHSFRVQVIGGLLSNRRTRWVQCAHCLTKRTRCRGIWYTWFGEVCNQLIEKKPGYDGWLHVKKTAGFCPVTYDHEAKP